MGIENPVHLLFVAAVALLVLGPRRLPELARSLGRGIRELREALGEGAAGRGKPLAGVDASRAAPPGPALADEVDPRVHVRSGDAPDRRPL
jgi:sec-independent protein translocase protein TatA